MKEKINGDVIFSYVDGIVFGAYTEGSRVDLAFAKYIVRKRKEFSNYQELPLLIDARYVKSITKEAREYLSTEEGYELISASAIMSDSILSRSIANFLIKFNFQKTPIPVRFFGDKNEALEWLKLYL